MKSYHSLNTTKPIFNLWKNLQFNTINKVYKDHNIIVDPHTAVGIGVVEKIPLLKNEWIRMGNSELLIKQLKNISGGIWSLNYIKHEGIKFKSIT